MKVVIIEDEKSIIDAIKLAFEFRWPEVNISAAQNGKEGILLVLKKHPDIVILDINLPDISGFEVLKEIRSFSSVPVIILTVRSEDADMLKGLEAGADDYIVKPFNYLTLLARIKAVLRRAENNSLQKHRSEKISPQLRIDLINQKVFVNGQIVKLTPIEYRLLIFLAQNKNKIVSNKRLTEEVWEKDYQGKTENIRIYIRRLRAKLHDDPPAMILNQHGSGYLFKD